MDIGVVCAADPRGVLGDGVQDWLAVGWGAAYDPQDLAGGRLLLERLGEVAVAGFQLLEQADVLDRDHGLVGEGLQELDLLVGESTGLHAPDHDDAERDSLSQQRRGERRPMPIAFGDLSALGVLFARGRLIILNVDGLAIDYSP